MSSRQTLNRKWRRTQLTTDTFQIRHFMKWKTARGSATSKHLSDNTRNSAAYGTPTEAGSHEKQSSDSIWSCWRAPASVVELSQDVSPWTTAPVRGTSRGQIMWSLWGQCVQFAHEAETLWERCPPAEPASPGGPGRSSGGPSHSCRCRDGWWPLRCLCHWDGKWS